MLRHALGILLLCGFRVTGEQPTFFLFAKESSDRGAIELQIGTTTKTVNLNALWILNDTYVNRPTVWTSQHGLSYVYFTAVHFESRTNCVARALIENLDNIIDGVGLSELTDSLREEYEIDPTISGVLVVSVDKMSSAFANGLRKGDLITDIAQKRVETVEDVQAIMSDIRSSDSQSMLLLVKRGDELRFLILKLG